MGAAARSDHVTVDHRDREPSPGPPTPAGQPAMLGLQQQVGNRAVAQLVRRRAGAADTAPLVVAQTVVVQRKREKASKEQVQGLKGENSKDLIRLAHDAEEAALDPASPAMVAFRDTFEKLIDPFLDYALDRIMTGGTALRVLNHMVNNEADEYLRSQREQVGEGKLEEAVSEDDEGESLKAYNKNAYSGAVAERRKEKLEKRGKLKEKFASALRDTSKTDLLAELVSTDRGSAVEELRQNRTIWLAAFDRGWEKIESGKQLRKARTVKEDGPSLEEQNRALLAGSMRKAAVNTATEKLVAEAKRGAGQFLETGDTRRELAGRLERTLEKKDVRTQAIALTLNPNSLDSGLTKLGRLIDLAAPEPGDKTTVSVQFLVPIHGIGRLGFRVKGVAARDNKSSISRDEETKEKTGITKGDQLTARLEIAIVGGIALVGGPEANAEIGGYIQAMGRNSGEVMNLYSYGLYRRFRESNLIPRGVTNGLWGHGSGTAARGWAGYEESMLFGGGSKNYVETGMLAGAKAKGKIAGDYASLSGGIGVTSGRRTDAKSIEEKARWHSSEGYGRRRGGWRSKVSNKERTEEGRGGIGDTNAFKGGRDTGRRSLPRTALTLSFGGSFGKDVGGSFGGTLSFSWTRIAETVMRQKPNSEEMEEVYTGNKEVRLLDVKAGIKGALTLKMANHKEPGEKGYVSGSDTIRKVATAISAGAQAIASTARTSKHKMDNETTGGKVARGIGTIGDQSSFITESVGTFTPASISNVINDNTSQWRTHDFTGGLTSGNFLDKGYGSVKEGGPKVVDKAGAKMVDKFKSTRKYELGMDYKAAFDKGSVKEHELTAELRTIDEKAFGIPTVLEAKLTKQKRVFRLRGLKPGGDGPWAFDTLGI